MKGRTKLVVYIVFVLLIGFIAIKWDIYRWHSFQKVTHSDIGYFKWKFLFDNSYKKR